MSSKYEYTNYQEYADCTPTDKFVILNIDFPSNLSDEEIRELLRTNYIKNYLDNNDYISEVKYYATADWYDEDNKYHENETVPSSVCIHRYIHIRFKNHCLNYYL